jgi:Haem-NO-binding
MYGLVNQAIHDMVCASLEKKPGKQFGFRLRLMSIDCSEIEADSLKLHYHSSRDGLAPMVFGLVKGLGTKFNTEVNITQTQSRQEGDENDTFLIQYKPN